MATIPYNKLAAGMVFHSHSDSPLGRLIQWAVTWGKPGKDTENHTGFVVEYRGQLIAAETDGWHFRLNSLEGYAGKRNRLVAVFDPVVSRMEREDLLNAIAYKVRKDFDRPYDVAGAVASAPLAHKLFPWLRQKKDSDFCSEVGYELVKETCGSLTWPLEWEKSPPNPKQYADWQRAHPAQWKAVTL